MTTCSWLATLLDEEMLSSGSISIAPRNTSDLHLSTNFNKTGRGVSNEIGGRFLLRYVRANDVGRYVGGSTAKHYTTPTAYTPHEAISYLALPNPTTPREFVMLIDPSKLGSNPVWGPRWVRLGNGIEYLLPNGFPSSSLVLPWEVKVS
jgi:hypothetical protein